MTIKTKKKILILFLGIGLIVVALFFILTKRGRKPESGNYSSYDKEQVHSDTTIEVYGLIFTEFNDFEKKFLPEKKNNIISLDAISGKQSFEIPPEREYGPSFSKRIGEIDNFSGLQDIKYKSQLKAFKGDKIFIVLSIEDAAGTSLNWTGKELFLDNGQTLSVDEKYIIKPEFIKKDNIIKIYLWNKNKMHILLDNVSIEFYGNTKNEIRSSVFIPERNIIYDFELPFPGDDSENFKNDFFVSGKTSYMLDNSTAYSPSIVKRVKDVIDSEFKLITISCWLYPLEEKSDIVIVASLKDEKGNEFSWNGRSSENGKFPRNKWTKHRAQFKLPFENIKPEDLVSVYLWNKSGNKVYIDDLEIVYGETNIRSGTTSLNDTHLVNSTNNLNGPPFQSKYFNKVEINNDNSPFLVNFNGNQFGNISPFQSLTVGNFTGEIATDQLAVIENNAVVIYAFCSTLSRFNKAHEFDIAHVLKDIKNPKLYSVDLNGDSNDELIVSNQKGTKITILSLLAPGTACEYSGNITPKILWSKSILSNKTRNLIITGDFNGDDYEEILIVNSLLESGYSLCQKGNAFIYSPIEMGNLTIERGEVEISTIPYSDFSRKVLVCNFPSSGKVIPQFYSFDITENTFQELKDNILPLQYLTGYFQLMPGNFTNENENELVIYNYSWRPDFKLFNGYEKAWSIKSVIDFSGFTWQNPRYYECRKFIIGKFTQRQQTEILSILKNCKDVNYKGGNCIQFEESDGFKNIVELFRLN